MVYKNPKWMENLRPNKKKVNEIDAIKKNDAVQKGPFWDTRKKEKKSRERVRGKSPHEIIWILFYIAKWTNRREQQQ